MAIIKVADLRAGMTIKIGGDIITLTSVQFRDQSIVVLVGNRQKGLKSIRTTWTMDGGQGVHLVSKG